MVAAVVEQQVEDFQRSALSAGVAGQVLPFSSQEAGDREGLECRPQPQRNQPVKLEQCTTVLTMLKRKPRINRDQALMGNSTLGCPRFRRQRPLKPGRRSGDAPIYQELGKEEGVLVIEQVFSAVLSQPELCADRIHPNAKGYQAMADGIHSALNKGRRDLKRS